MNMAKEYTVHTYQGGQLTPVIPTELEKRLARRLASTFYMMVREAKKGNKQEALYVSDVLGQIWIRPKLRGKRRYTLIQMGRGEMKYEEMRMWLTLAIQYLMDEYPAITYDMSQTIAEVCFLSNRSLWDVETG